MGRGWVRDGDAMTRGEGVGGREGAVVGDAMGLVMSPGAGEGCGVVVGGGGLGQVR